MDKQSAQIISGTPETVAKLLKGKTTEEAAIAVMEAFRKIPGPGLQMGQQLAKLVNSRFLEVNNGIFVGRPGADINTDHAEEILDNAIRFFSSTESISGMGRWILGNIADILVLYWGYDIGDLMTGTELAYNTIQTSMATFRFFRQKRYPMPFSHHKAICYAADLSDRTKHEIAAYASEHGLPLTKVTGIIKLAQKQTRALGGNQIGTNEEGDPVYMPPVGMSSPEDFHAELKQHPEPPEPSPTRWLVVLGEHLRIVDEKPDGAELEEADFCFEIGADIRCKPQPEQGGAGPVKVTAGQVLPPAGTVGAGITPGDIQW